MTSAASIQAQNRIAGPRCPAITASSSTSSSAMCMWAGWGEDGISSQSRSRRAEALELDVSDHRAGFGHHGAVLLLDGGVAVREAAGAMPHVCAGVELAGHSGPVVVDLQVRCGGDVAVLCHRERDRRKRLIGEGRERAAVDDLAAAAREAVSISAEAGLDHHAAEFSLDDPAADVDEHALVRLLFVLLIEGTHAVRHFGHQG